jgi:hypothetical protein
MYQISATRAKSIDMQTHYRIKEATKLKTPKILHSRDDTRFSVSVADDFEKGVFAVDIG